MRVEPHTSRGARHLDLIVGCDLLAPAFTEYFSEPIYFSECGGDCGLSSGHKAHALFRGAFFACFRFADDFFLAAFTGEVPSPGSAIATRFSPTVLMLKLPASSPLS